MYVNESSINLSLLPKKLQNIVEELSKLAQVTQEHALNEVLAITSLCVGAKYKIKNPFLVKSAHCNNYYITIAKSGERKSTVQDMILEYYENLYTEGLLVEKYAAQERIYNAEIAAWDSEGKKSKKKTGFNDFGNDQINNEPQVPIDPEILIDDMTREGLFYKLSKGLPWCGIWSAEGGTLFTSIGMNKENQGKLYLMLNKLWSNEKITSTRMYAKGTRGIPRNTVVSLNLAMQESVFYKYIATDNCEELGFTARLLICKPKSLAGTRVPEEIKTEENSAFSVFQRLIGSNLINITQSYQKTRKLNFQTLQLSPQAKEYFKTIWCQIEEGQKEDGSYEHYGAFASKLPQHVLRLAVNLMWLDDVLNKEVTLEHIKGAYELGLWYMKQQKTLIKPHDRKDNKLRSLLERTERYIRKQEAKNAYFISHRDLLRNPLQLIEIAMREEVISLLVKDKILEDHRYDDKEVMINGKHCKSFYTIVKKDIDMGDIKADPNDVVTVNNPSSNNPFT